MGDRRQQTVFTASTTNYDLASHCGPRCATVNMGQQQHLRKLWWYHNAADFFVRASGLRRGLPRVLPLVGGFSIRDQLTRAKLPQHDWPDPWARLLQPVELVPAA